MTDLHIHTFPHNICGKGLELHPSQFKARRDYFHKEKKTSKYVILLSRE